ncbi:MAG: hypothetical protein QGI45_00490 [Myxococcota bacterium]|jgi:hypothetical protein|nr:hypothetical protein [Myxococcota bacterium]
MADTKTTPISEDELLAADLGLLAKPANLFRLRLDDKQVVLDFAHVPPLLPNEIDNLKAGDVKVHSRIALPADLAQEFATQLTKILAEAV